MGLGLFAYEENTNEDAARQVVDLINRAVKVAQPFYDGLASQAVMHSKINVMNNGRSLYDRFSFFLKSYYDKRKECNDRKDERHIEKQESPYGTTTIIHSPAYELATESRWLALAAIDAFFSWTEHIFIHMAILKGRIKTAGEVAALAEADWHEKFKRALDLEDQTTKTLSDKLVDIRKGLRNFVAHGAFGKQGEAFEFHSSAGAVPVLLPRRAGSQKFRLGGGGAFDEHDAVGVIEAFIEHLWAGPRRPAEIYIQQSGLPLILTMAASGAYANAMTSADAMTELVDHLMTEFDRAADMDW